MPKIYEYFGFIFYFIQTNMNQYMYMSFIETERAYLI